MDVFSKKPLSGNGLTVFISNNELPANTMQQITIEMRQFESIFLQSTEHPDTFKAKIYTMQEELDFAGHPILGAACVLHEKYKPSDINTEWKFLLNTKNVHVTSKYCISWYEAVMEQGEPIFNPPLNEEQTALFLNCLNLSEDNREKNLPLQVVSTGLPYLIVPIKSGIEKAHIARSDFENLLRTVGAKFVYVFDITNNEGRTWDNEGKTEDIATGSAAGPMGAYLVNYQQASVKNFITINQGRFLGRASQIKVKVDGSKDKITFVQVGGDVCMVAHGIFKNY